MSDNGLFTPECTHCENEITTDQLCFRGDNRQKFYHRSCYYDVFTLDCEYCDDEINLNTDTALPTKNGHYHRDCYFKDNADEHCNNCSTPLVTGQNLHKTTNDDGDTIYLCSECSARETKEKARDMINNLENQLNEATGPSKEEQERLGLYDTPDGWQQEDRE